MAGRLPTPTALKVITGNPGKRALPADEPEPDLLLDLEPPAHLHEDSATVWRELAAPLHRAKVLTTIDTVALELLANDVALHRRAQQEIEGGDKVFARNKETGAISLQPWTIVRSMSAKSALALLREFGMTPAARTRVKAVLGQGDLFGGGGGAGAGDPFTRGVA